MDMLSNAIRPLAVHEVGELRIMSCFRVFHF